MDLLLQPKRGKEEKSPDASSAAAPNVVVAVKASKEISRAAILWALAHVVQPGDCVTLLVVLPTHRSGRRLWGFPRFSGDCAHSSRKSSSSTAAANATDWCSQMLLKLNDAYDPTKINVKVKSVPGSPSGSVAAESKKVNSSWVVLDKHLKDEEKRCLEELQCNIVVMKGKSSQPKVLRLNLVAPEEPRPSSCPLPPSKPEKPPETSSKTTATATVTTASSLNQARVAEVTPNSSPEVESSFTATTDPSTSSASSSDTGASPSSILSEIEQRRNNKKEEPVSSKERNDSDTASSGSEDERASSSAASVKRRPWVTELLNTRQLVSELVDRKSQRFAAANKSQNAIARAITEKLSKLDGESTAEDVHSCRSDVDYSTNVREVISLTRNAPPGPPPLCSICQHKAPVFGKPPRWFSYAELELATGGFSKANFLAEGGFGSVHRGVLPDGQAVAVKQHKLASCQGDLEFCSEVEVLSCAQHRNVVMLIGYCIEGSRRLLVYEYICNGSLDTHLYGSKNQTLEWSARQKIAVGAARGLRYLHEECRVGCIVHRDMRPNNILITHDFEPLVGDFGLARWQPDGDLGVDTRVIGTFGYLAPEYAQSGQVTEKADVYSFGVVLVELITGRKAVDINRPKGQQCLSEWARPLLEQFAVKELIDPRLGSRYSEQEVAFMVHAASLCIRRDPNARPRMSQVLRILEGDVMMECNYTSPLNYDISGSGRYHRVPSRHDDNEDDDHKTGSFREDVGNLGEKMSCGTSIRCPEPMSASKRYSFT